MGIIGNIKEEIRIIREQMCIRDRYMRPLFPQQKVRKGIYPGEGMAAVGAFCFLSDFNRAVCIGTFLPGEPHGGGICGIACANRILHPDR